MPPPSDPITFLCTVGFAIAEVFGVGLWTFALFRTGLSVFYIMIVAGVLGFVLSVVNLVLFYNPPFVPQFLGRTAYAPFFYVFIWSQLLSFVLALVGFTLMVRWMCTAQRRLQSTTQV
jgi:hypothetical protein